MLGLVAVLALSGCKPSLVGEVGAPETLILRSGTIYTMNDDGTVAEAMVVRDGEIIYVGDDEGTRAYEDHDVAWIDLSDKTVFPGFHDAHTHLVMGGTDLLYVDLFDVTTVEQLVDSVRTWAEQHPDAPWVQGSGWSMARFDGLLHESQLDAVVPDRPVFLYSSDAHTAFVNSRALALAGISADTPDPEDGQIERDSKGEPTGVLQESAWELVAELIPPHPVDWVDEGLALAMHEANQFGITTITDASVRDWMLAAYARAEANGFQLHAHVIGDAAARQSLETLEVVIAANGISDRRPQLAHLEVVDPHDWPRFAALGAHANFQMQWAYPDPYIQELTLPMIGEPRSQYLYPIEGLHAAGATIVAGSDWPVSSMNPFEAIEVAVTRQDPWANAGEVLTPEHRIDLETALRAYTSEGAKATFSEDLVGSLEVGKRADFVVVDRDPFTISAHELSEVQVEATWLDGEAVFERAKAGQHSGSGEG